MDSAGKRGGNGADTEVKIVEVDAANCATHKKMKAALALVLGLEAHAKMTKANALNHVAKRARKLVGGCGVHVFVNHVAKRARKLVGGCGVHVFVVACGVHDYVLFEQSRIELFDPYVVSFCPNKIVVTPLYAASVLLAAASQLPQVPVDPLDGQEGGGPNVL